MQVGTGQVEITPEIGAELSGFAVRSGPSTGVLDPLWARALSLTDGRQRLLWLHCDLIGFDHGIVTAFRERMARRRGFAAGEVLLTATHTHAGPCTIHLAEAGAYDEPYVQRLLDWLEAAADQALQKTEPCDVVHTEGRLALAIHRAHPAMAHTDPRVGIMGFKRGDGSFAAIIANYAMHPVSLGFNNRLISGDIYGQAAGELSARLPGQPVVLMTNGACGNLNPPAENVSPDQMRAWSRHLTEAILPPLLGAPAAGSSASLRIARASCSLPLDTLDHAGINACADAILRQTASAPDTPWNQKLRRAAELWRQSLDAAVASGRAAGAREIEIFAVGLGPVVLLGINAELFSEFTDRLRRESGRPVHCLGYANGDWGYLCPRPAYALGGYEVELAHLFYGAFRFSPGGLERIADAATALIRREFAGG